jgi:hypothetical protein
MRVFVASYIKKILCHTEIEAESLEKAIKIANFLPHEKFSQNITIYDNNSLQVEEKEKENEPTVN